MVKGATNKRRSKGPFARAHLGLDGGRRDDAHVGADGLRHGSTTACHLTLGSPAKNDYSCVTSKCRQQLRFSTIRQPIDNLYNSTQ